MSELTYLSGFGNEFESEALSNALPKGRFSPQRVNYGLYAEQFNSTAFTAPRAENRRNWFYRIRPSALHGAYYPLVQADLRTAPEQETPCPPDQLRWNPFPIPDQPLDFIDGLLTLATNGNAAAQQGIGIHMYRANRSMETRFFCNADGELLLVPQQGGLMLHTECGLLAIGPGDIGVIPRGMKFRVVLQQSEARGYICENYGNPLILAERGPVGANGYANDRDFEAPVAAFEDREGTFELVTKFMGRLYGCELGHSPLDVVAWTGNSVPYRYDLGCFNVMNTVSYDHPDPSIFTVLTSPSGTPGVANVDFVIFPPRWMVAEDTFRPPWYHRNIMSEFMGLIRGTYDAKEEGFEPGGASLHNCFTAHGPEAAVFDKASSVELKPQRYEDTLAFMFESRYVIQPTRMALDSPQLQADYLECWSGLQKHFTGRQ
ncbi:MAG TPA: homogentisate 1,2-dioxygenase [Thiolinea sp.]|nr:homogentisate 1,2-dioxygenase [Thiolinea sp.]